MCSIKMFNCLGNTCPSGPVWLSWDMVRFILCQIVMVLIDIFTDIHTAVTLTLSGHKLWGCATLVFVFEPMIIAMLKAEKEEREKRKKPTT